jgi:23S rRNA pseudouridine1911/1915/1917 synthase
VERIVALVVDPSEGRPRLDLFLVRHLPESSRAAIRRWILSGNVTVEGKRAKPSAHLRPGDRVRVEIPAAAPTRLIPEPFPLEILHEDDDLIVVLKPPGMVVHPGAGAARGTLVHALLARPGSLSQIGGEERPGIVHRLDRDTSGLLVVAKNDAAHRSLSGQFSGRAVNKVYLALVWGRLDPPRGRIEAPIGRHPASRTRMAVRRAGGREAVSEYATRESLGPFSFLEVRIHTGRTHQIRVHLSHLRHPIVGDSRYGGDGLRTLRSAPAKACLGSFLRLALHAHRLEFRHPSSGEPLRFEAPLPEDFERLLDCLRAVS